MRKTIKEIFDKGIELHHYANTAYPLTPNSFKEFRINDKNLIDKLVIEEWNQSDEIALYAHIPFCQKRCNFCEYSVLSGDDADKEEEYVKLLLTEIEKYGSNIDKKKVIGLDIGGGTPTKIETKNLELILNSLRRNFQLEQDIGISIETTPIIAAEDYEKIKAINEMGIQRISMGVQTIDPTLLKDFDRKGSVKKLIEATQNIRKAGFERFNIDLMYGFLNQSIESFESTIKFVLDNINPEYVTLYRNRYKGTKLEHEAKDVSLKIVNEQYDLAFQMLNSAGFTSANHGKNTFSRVQGDVGTSEYLTKRVIEGTPYLGMGLGAQSFGPNSLAYNQGAASKQLSQYEKAIGEGNLPIQDFYLLPQDEVMAKMTSVAFYFGYLDKQAFQNKFGIGLEDKFSEEMNFLRENGLMFDESNKFSLTELGKDKLSGIIPLFYSQKSQMELFSHSF